MKPIDLIKFAITGLRRRAARTFLTVLGVIIGTVCIVLMFGVGLSSYEQFEQSMMENQNLKEIVVYSDSSGGGMMMASEAGIGQSTGINDSTVASLETLEHVDVVSPVIQLPLTLKAERYRGTFYVRCVKPEILDLDFAEGGMFFDQGAVASLVIGGFELQNMQDPDNPPVFSSYEEQESYKPDIDLLNTEMEMTLGYDYGEAMAGEDAPPASQRYRARVSGVTKKDYSDGAYYSYMDIATAKRLIAENRELAQYNGINAATYNEVRILVDDMDNVQAVMDEVQKLNLRAESPMEYIEQEQERQAQQQGQLFAIGFISLLVSAIGIANTMYANILERRRDIGVMKVVGMKIRQIRSLFLVESSAIGLLGGLIGIGISYIVVMFINTGSGESNFLGIYFYSGMTVSIPLWLSLAALAIAIGVGVLSGIYPAHKATKMSPLEAMRNSH